ncbi:MAG: trehalase family glycosidase [Actinomycetota bacterium]|nr:trehalase family glycosidase [Actinomycetota bacterium]
MEKATTGHDAKPRDGGLLERRDWEELERESRRVFALNEVEQGDIYYHMPSHLHYPSLFAWDSGFHAAAMSVLDSSRARRELETLMRQVSSDGHLPHEVLLPNRGSHRWLRGLETRLVKWEFDGRGASFMIDPPIYHYAVEMVYRRCGDTAWLKRIWHPLRRCLDYLLRSRRLRGDGLVAVFHPWETGTDLSPQFFQALGLRDRGHTSAMRAELCPTLLYVFNRTLGWKPRRLAAADRFVWEDLTVNSIAARACRSMAFLAGELGRRREEGEYGRRAGEIMRALDALCWDERRGCYFPRFGYRRPRKASRRTAASLLPLFTGLCTRERARRMIEGHLLDEEGFWTPYPVPFNPEAEIAGAGPWVDRHLWSGHCVWVNFSWMLSIGLAEYGYLDEARELTRRVVRMVLREGFYEYYDSRSGEGRRIRDFCWPALALEMMARFWPQAADACGA